MDVNLGYSVVSINLKKDGITPFRKAVGDPNQIASTVIQNLRDLRFLLEWNEKHCIRFYRLSNNLAISGIAHLPRQDEILTELDRIGRFVSDHNHRLSFHCSHYAVLCSPKWHIVQKAIEEIENQSEFFDMLGFFPSHWNKINIHVGGAYGDKISSLDKWVKSWRTLSEFARKRLVVENDDKASMFGVKDLYEGIFEKVGVPITFDSFHHNFCNRGESQKEAAVLAASTWNSAPPCFHFASSKVLNENKAIKTAHADWVHEDIINWETGAWVMVESSARDLAVLNYMQNGKGFPSENFKELFDYDQLVSSH